MIKGIVFVAVGVIMNPNPHPTTVNGPPPPDVKPFVRPCGVDPIGHIRCLHDPRTNTYYSVPY